MTSRAMHATHALLRQWDLSANPIFLAAAGQLRQALRSDGRNDVATTHLIIPVKGWSDD